jgi:hypothetical protein
MDLGLQTSKDLGALLHDRLRLPASVDVWVSRHNGNYEVAYYSLTPDADAQAAQKAFQDSGLNSTLEVSGRARDHLSSNTTLSAEQFSAFVRKLGLDKQVDELIKKDRQAAVRVAHVEGEPTPSITLYFNSPEAAAAARGKLLKELQADPATTTGTSKTNGYPYLTFPIKGNRPASYYEDVIRTVTREVSGTYWADLARFTGEKRWADFANPNAQTRQEEEQWRLRMSVNDILQEPNVPKAKPNAETRQDQQQEIRTGIADILREPNVPKALQNELRQAQAHLEKHDGKALREAAGRINKLLIDAALDNTMASPLLRRFNQLLRKCEEYPAPSPQGASRIRKPSRRRRRKQCPPQLRKGNALSSQHSTITLHGSRMPP